MVDDTDDEESIDDVEGEDVKLLEDERAGVDVEAEFLAKSAVKWIALAVQHVRSCDVLSRYQVKIPLPVFLTFDFPQGKKEWERQQASLNDLLEKLLPDRSKEDHLAAKNRLKAMAQKKMEIGYRGWEAITEAKWGELENRFSGKMHCECIISCLRGLAKEDAEAMGFSEIWEILRASITRCPKAQIEPVS